MCVVLIHPFIPPYFLWCIQMTFSFSRYSRANIAILRLPYIIVLPGYNSCEHNLLTGQHNHARSDEDTRVRLAGVPIGSDVCRFKVQVYCTFVLNSTGAGTFKLLHIRLGNTDSMHLVVLGQQSICVSREPTPHPKKPFASYFKGASNLAITLTVARKNFQW